MAVRVNQEWPDMHRDAPYPFKDTATLRATNGSFDFDRRWVVDGRFWPVSDSSRLYLRSLQRSGTTLTMVVATVAGREGQAVVDIASTAKRAVFFDSKDNQIGYLQSVAGWGFMRDYPEDPIRFGINATEFIPTVVSPQVRGGVTSVIDSANQYLNDEWRFVGGEGVELVAGTNAFAVNIVGDELYRRDACAIPAEIGLIMHPVRFIHWRDLNTGHVGIVRPKRGRILSAINQQLSSDPRERGHQSPAADKLFITQMGG